MQPLSSIAHLTLVCAIALPAAVLAAEMRCPPMPSEITTVTREVKVDIQANAGRLGKVSAAEVALKTDIAAKAMFDKYPNLDKLLILQTLTSTYCSALNSSGLSGTERVERWEKFMERYLELKQTAPVPKPTTKTAPARKPELTKPTPSATPSSAPQQSTLPPTSESKYRTALELATQDHAEQSRKLLLELALAGHAKAQYQLGRASILGDIMPQSYAEAFRWFSLSAKAGVPAAQHNLAVLYQDGLGTTKDDNQALIWFAEAARGGNFASQDLLRKLGRSW
jgi:hypothetical protein